MTQVRQVAPYRRTMWLLGRVWWPAVIAAVAVLVAAFLVLRPAPPASGLVGKAAPNWTLRDIAGHTMSLRSLRGHPVVLNFWGTTCPPCRREVPLLQLSAVAHKSSGLVVIGLDAQLDDAASVRAFALERNITYTMLLDPNGSVAPLYGVADLPHSFFIDRSGMVRADSPSPFLDTAPLERAILSIK